MLVPAPAGDPDIPVGGTRHGVLPIPGWRQEKHTR